MVHRDPETGQFLSHESQYDDVEVASFSIGIGVQAADLSGATGFSGGDTGFVDGMPLIDYDEIVDRNEALDLLYASHALMVYANSTETADGTVTAAVEISASPTRQVVPLITSSSDTPGDESGLDFVGSPSFDDSIDILGRVMMAGGTGPFSDGATGVGGGGMIGLDTWDSSMFPAEFGRFHPRDELFGNFEMNAWNIDDAGIHCQLQGQHVYGVVEE